jgi:hypothetical protein
MNQRLLLQQLFGHQVNGTLDPARAHNITGMREVPDLYLSLLRNQSHFATRANTVACQSVGYLLGVHHALIGDTQTERELHGKRPAKSG